MARVVHDVIGEGSRDTATGRSGASSVALASLWSAVVTYVVMTVAAWALPVADTTALLTFLAMLFATYGVMSGVSLETTRSIAAAARDDRAEGPAVWRVAAVVAVAAALIALVLAPVWRTVVLHDASTGLVLALVLALLGYGCHAVLVGAQAGRGWWTDAALVIGGEATVRMLLTLLVVAVGASVTSLGLASAAGAFAWVVLLLVSPRGRQAARLRADCATPTLARRMLASVLAQGASALLVVGFPILLAATTPRAEYEAAAPLLLAISLTRAPVLLPLNALQGVAVSHLVHAGNRLGGLVARLLLLVGGVGAVGAVAAWLIGPWLMETFLGADYRVSGPVLGALTLAAAAMAALTVTGACVQALSAHAWYVAGWVVAVVCSLLLLQVPGSLQDRTLLALGLAPIPGLVVHLVGLVRSRG